MEKEKQQKKMQIPIYEKKVDICDNPEAKTYNNDPGDINLNKKRDSINNCQYKNDDPTCKSDKINVKDYDKKKSILTKNSNFKMNESELSLQSQTLIDSERSHHIPETPMNPKEAVNAKKANVKKKKEKTLIINTMEDVAPLHLKMHSKETLNISSTNNLGINNKPDFGQMRTRETKQEKDIDIIQKSNESEPEISSEI